MGKKSVEAKKKKEEKKRAVKRQEKVAKDTAH